MYSSVTASLRGISLSQYIAAGEQTPVVGVPGTPNQDEEEKMPMKTSALLVWNVHNEQKMHVQAYTIRKTPPILLMLPRTVGNV